MPLTDAEIDGLSGRELDAAVCLAIGWTHLGIWWQDPLSGFQFPHPRTIHNNPGLAFGLLLTLDGIPWEIDKYVSDELLIHAFVAYGCWVPIATGPKSEAASVMCRAYLKLKARA